MSRDFFGFSFNGVYSGDLNIVRISNGDRYNDHLLPELEDKIVEIPGNDGQYYFGSYYSKREFNIEFAFDSVTEENFRELRQLFNTRDLVPLVFDERPYITYFVKVQSPPEFNFVCFDEKDLTANPNFDIIEEKRSVRFPVLFPKDPKTGDPIETGIEEKKYNVIQYKKKRIYKGEGSISLIAYNPFGKCFKKFLKDYNDENKREWAAASGLLEEKPTNLDSYRYTGSESKKQGVFNIYNPGDLESPPLILIPFSSNFLTEELSIGITSSSNTRRIILKPISKKGQDFGILINCQNNLIEGVVGDPNNYTTTGNIYNEYIKAGNFFKINCTNTIEETVDLQGEGISESISEDDKPSITYDYYYI